jgi:hypothetical protein
MVAFRGSYNAANWQNNAKIKLVPYDYMRSGNAGHVHQGFKETFDEINRPVLLAIERVLNERKTKYIFFTGHSLGGPLATLLALQFSRTVSSDQLRLFTFGAPRMGDQEFGTFAENSIGIIRRVVEEKDWIPRIPGRGWKYAHFGTEYYQEGNLSMLCHSAEDDPDCSSKWTTAASAHHQGFQGKPYFNQRQESNPPSENELDKLGEVPMLELCKKKFGPQHYIVCLDTKDMIPASMLK